MRRSRGMRIRGLAVELVTAKTEVGALLDGHAVIDVNGGTSKKLF